MFAVAMNVRAPALQRFHLAFEETLREGGFQHRVGAGRPAAKMPVRDRNPLEPAPIEDLLHRARGPEPVAQGAGSMEGDLGLAPVQPQPVERHLVGRERLRDRFPRVAREG